MESFLSSRLDSSAMLLVFAAAHSTLKTDLTLFPFHFTLKVLTCDRLLVRPGSLWCLWGLRTPLLLVPGSQTLLSHFPCPLPAAASGVATFYSSSEEVACAASCHISTSLHELPDTIASLNRVHTHVKCSSEHTATADATRKFPRCCYF